MTVRYAYIVNGQTIWGPGPNPYFITLQNGDIWEISAHTVAETEAKGIFVVEQVNKKELDERFEQALTPVYSIVNGRPRETWSYTLIPAARNNMLNAIDEKAEAARSQISTNYTGQFAEYEEAYKEALEVAALPYGATITPGTYPYLEADIDVTFSPTLNRNIDSVREAADFVIETRNQWKTFGAMIRTNRLLYKKQIRDAETDAEAYQIYLQSTFI